METIVDGIAFGESPRWHDGRVWFSDWARGRVTSVEADGSAARVEAEVADDLQFPNGMAVTGDGSTLVVAESHAERLTAYDIAEDGTLSGRRVWAATPGDHPDGICLDETGAVWFADVGQGHCRRAREGGELLDTVVFGRGAFACTLSRVGTPTLFVVGQDYGGPQDGPPSGVLGAFPAPHGGAGHP